MSEEMSVDKTRLIHNLRQEVGNQPKRNITFSLPAKLIENFKTECSCHSLKMNQVVKKLIEEFCENKGQKVAGN